MTNCNSQTTLFTALGSRKVDISFEGGSITSDAGIMLVAQADRRIGLTSVINQIIPDNRHQSYVEHPQLHMLKQEIYGLCAGWRDLNDHDSLRHDIAMQTAVGSIDPLASSPTLCRLLSRADAQTNHDLNKSLVEFYIKSQRTCPKEIVLDFDATDCALHGDQEGKYFNAHYDEYVYLPLLVFIGRHPVCALLRKAERSGSHGTCAVLRYLVRKLRTKWPNVRIIFRGDSGFSAPEIIGWCEKNDVRYITGMSPNSKINAITESFRDSVKGLSDYSHQKEKQFTEVRYKAATWPCERRVVVKAEHNREHTNTNIRYVVTDLENESPEYLYSEFYCDRGNMELRIKETQLDMFGTRMSCTSYQSNWMRLLFSVFGYLLMHTVRDVGLKGTSMASATCASIREKLIKIGAVVTRNTRRIRILCSESFPLKELYYAALLRLSLRVT